MKDLRKLFKDSGISLSKHFYKVAYTINFHTLQHTYIIQAIRIIQPGNIFGERNFKFVHIRVLLDLYRFQNSLKIVFNLERKGANRLFITLVSKFL